MARGTEGMEPQQVAATLGHICIPCPPAGAGEKMFAQWESQRTQDLGPKAIARSTSEDLLKGAADSSSVGGLDHPHPQRRELLPAKGKTSQLQGPPAWRPPQAPSREDQREAAA